MKKFFGFFLALVIASSFAFAGDYNTTGVGSIATPETGTVLATGSVKALPITLSPESRNIPLPAIYPGTTQGDIATPWVTNQFTLTSQATYGLIIKVTDLDVDCNEHSGDCHVLWAWRFGGSTTFPSGYAMPSDWNVDGWWRINVGDENDMITGAENDGSLFGQCGIYYFAADDGAPVGTRTFDLGFSIAYNDGL